MLACTPPPNNKGLLVGLFRKLILFCDLGSDLQEFVDVLVGMAVQRGDTDDAVLVDGVNLARRVEAGVGTLVDDYTGFLVGAGGLLTGKLVKDDGHDQVALGQVRHFNGDVDAFHIQQALDLVRTVQQAVQQGTLVQHDTVHALNIEGAAVLGVGEMLADPADVVEDSAQHRVHAGSAAAHFPLPAAPPKRSRTTTMLLKPIWEGAMMNNG